MGKHHRQTEYYKGAGVFFDTHAHLYDERFEEEGMSPDTILANAAAAHVTSILVPADNEETSKKAYAYAKENTGKHGIKIYCSVGVHPHDAKTYTDKTKEYLRQAVAEDGKTLIRAIGEIGLDYYYDLSPRDVQREVFEKQILLSKDADMPFILHERDATGDTLDILRKHHKAGSLRGRPGVCHCCSMSAEAAAELVKMGFYIGFDGPLTFKNNRKGIELAASVPKDRIVIETDSPYLTPEPNRGKINEPAHVPYVAVRLAEILGMTVEEIADLTYANAMNLYEL